MYTLAEVKNALGVTGTYQDSTISVYIAEVVEFLKGAGVPESSMSSGIIARGVADLWQYGSGDGKLSPYFMMRATQLSLKAGAFDGI